MAGQVSSFRVPAVLRGAHGSQTVLLEHVTDIFVHKREQVSRGERVKEQFIKANLIDIMHQEMWKWENGRTRNTCVSLFLDATNLSYSDAQEEPNTASTSSGRPEVVSNHCILVKRPCEHDAYKI